MSRKILYLTFLLIICSLLSACAANSSAQPIVVDDPAATISSGNANAMPEAQPDKTSGSTLDMYPKKTGKPYVIQGVTYYPLEDVSDDYVEIGIASWYGNDFHGKSTANGETYNMNDMTAAHKTLPMPTFVRVKNLENNKEAVVRVNDRGPFSKGRIIDLSYAAAKALDMTDAGTAKVQVTVLSQSTDHLRTENKDIDIDKGAYVVQIGSFADPNNANRLAERFNNAIVRKVEINSEIRYRVQLRGYTSKPEAYAAARDLEYEFTGAFVLAE